MKTITMTVHLYEFTKWSLHTLRVAETNDPDYIFLGKKEVTFEIPEDRDLVAAKVVAIDKQIEDVRTAFHGKLAQLNEQKAKLLCLENEVTT